MAKAADHFTKPRRCYTAGVLFEITKRGEMKRLILLIALLVTGCQAVDWQPYAALYPTAATTQTPTDQANPTQDPQSSCIVTAAQSLNLRAGASINHAVVDWLAAGDLLTRTGNQRGAWIEVITPAGLRGWVNSDYCKNEVTK